MCVLSDLHNKEGYEFLIVVLFCFAHLRLDATVQLLFLVISYVLTRMSCVQAVSEMQKSRVVVYIPINTIVHSSIFNIVILINLKLSLSICCFCIPCHAYWLASSSVPAICISGPCSTPEIVFIHSLLDAKLYHSRTYDAGTVVELFLKSTRCVSTSKLDLVSGGP